MGNTRAAAITRYGLTADGPQRVLAVRSAKESEPDANDYPES